MVTFRLTAPHVFSSHDGEHLELGASDVWEVAGEGAGLPSEEYRFPLH